MTPLRAFDKLLVFIPLNKIENIFSCRNAFFERALIPKLIKTNWVYFQIRDAKNWLTVRNAENTSASFLHHLILI